MPADNTASPLMMIMLNFVKPETHYSMEDPGPSSAYYRRFAATADGPIRPPSGSREPLLEPSQSTAEFIDSASEGSLYSLLNVSRDASTAEIKERYRSLAGIYHPDKQPDDTRRQAAHERFQAIQRAHEVLTDPQRRAVYDMFGEEGLRTNWELGPRNMSSGEIKSHFAKQAENKRRMDAEALVNSQGDMSVVVDARAVFLSRRRFKNPEAVSHTPLARIRRVRPGQVLMRHSFETPINDNTQLIMEGTMAARQGAGGANVSGTIKHQFSPRFWAQYTQTFLAPLIGSVKGTYTIDDNTYLTGNAVVQTFAAPPRMTLTLGRRLYAETTGFITYKTGFFALGPWGASIEPQLAMADTSALSVGVTTQRVNGSGWTTELQTGIQENGLSLDWRTPFLGLMWKIGGGIDIRGGLNAFADATGQVTEHTTAGATVQAGLDGIKLKLHLSRVGQKLALPILLSPELNPIIGLCTTVIPASAWAALYHFYLLPRKQQRIKNRIAELRTEHADYIAQKKREAEDAVLLMSPSVARKAASEKDKNGLVILSAHYGPASAFTIRGMRDTEQIIDVTIPLQALVQQSKLHIPAGPAKFNLLGFWDPCIGENKKLRVRYLFKGETHEVTVDDVSTLRAPVRAHLL